MLPERFLTMFSMTTWVSQNFLSKSAQMSAFLLAFLYTPAPAKIIFVSA